MGHHIKSTNLLFLIIDILSVFWFYKKYGNNQIYIKCCGKMQCIPHLMNQVSLCYTYFLPFHCVEWWCKFRFIHYIIFTTVILSKEGTIQGNSPLINIEWKGYILDTMNQCKEYSLLFKKYLLAWQNHYLLTCMVPKVAVFQLIHHITLINLVFLY